MTSMQQTLQTSNPTIRVAPVLGTGLLAAALVLGGLALSRQSVITHTTPAAAVPVFDAVQFRAGERAAFGSAAVFDAVQFRAQERLVISPAGRNVTGATGGGHSLAK